MSGLSSKVFGSLKRHDEVGAGRTGASSDYFQGSTQYTGIRVPGAGVDRSQPQMTTNNGRRGGRTMRRNLGAPKRQLGASTVLSKTY